MLEGVGRIVLLSSLVGFDMVVDEFRSFYRNQIHCRRQDEAITGEKGANISSIVQKTVDQSPL